MSRENVENVRAAYEAIARRDRTALEALITEHVATDFEYEAFLTGRTYQGVDGFWEFLDDIRETVGFTPDVQEIVDLDEHVLIVVQMSGRGSQSGVPVAQQAAVLLTFDGSTLRSGKAFASRDEALEALGLRESPTSSRQASA
jgi:ketosteroid isomerase-like protein